MRRRRRLLILMVLTVGVLLLVNRTHEPQSKPPKDPAHARPDPIVTPAPSVEVVRDKSPNRIRPDPVAPYRIVRPTKTPAAKAERRTKFSGYNINGEPY